MQIEGWINDTIATTILDAFDLFQKEHGICGAVMEIGVHHGKFFIPIHNKIKGEECSYAVDLFSNQHLNIDRSGRGAKDIFQANLEKYAKAPQQCIIIEGDSTALDYQKILLNKALINQRMRIISVDGSHTMEATAIDLMEAEKLLISGGVIFVDDYYNYHWPGVACGVAKFFLHHTPRIAPFFLGLNKLILCHNAWHHEYLNLMKELTTNNKKKKSTLIYGHSAISVTGWE